MTKQCPSCGGECGRTKKSGCQYGSDPACPDKWLQAAESELHGNGFDPHIQSYHRGWVAAVEAAKQWLRDQKTIASFELSERIERALK